MEQKSAIQQVLGHEVTKVIFIVATTFSIVKMVILPLQEIQINLAQVQKDIVVFQGYKTLIDQNTTDIAILKTELEQKNGK